MIQYLPIQDLINAAESTDDKIRLAFIVRTIHGLSKLARGEIRKPDWQIVQMQEALDKEIRLLADEDVRKQLLDLTSGSLRDVYVLSNTIDVRA